MVVKQTQTFVGVRKGLMAVAGTVVFSAAILPLGIAAAATEVSNTVSATADTGGNEARGGKIIEGKASVDVFVETVINGETVTHVEEHIESETGEPAEFSYDETVVSEDGEGAVRTRVEAHAGGVLDQEQNLEDSREDDHETGNLREEGAKSFSLRGFFVKLFTYVWGLF